ncbi:ARM repeat-containing protein [Infundibulicybe gibba]|nr:ARM repeat-containing protein [Infundibulicybe gibba]
MESTARIVQTWMASGRQEEVDEIVSDITNGSIALLDVVKALGEFLTSEEDQLRRKGVELLSSVVAHSPVEKLNPRVVRVLTAFYCGKLDDTETIIPALQGLVTLTALPTFAISEVSAVINALFTHVHMKTLVQSVRFSVFSIIDTLMARHRNALKAMGSPFITGYIALAEGEKDPRNLLVAFAIARALFNITFCYFPITFRPPPNDPYGITTDDLRLALRGCLGATPAFGFLAIPVFLEKLMAGSSTTKRDTLQAIAFCLPVYGTSLARSSGRKLWSSLKLEIFQPVDPATEEEALRTTQVLIKTIYSSEEGAMETNDDVQGLARSACEECIQILREPEKSQARPAIKVICAFMKTTPSISRYTLSQAVPHLIKLFLDPDEISNRPPVLVLLGELITAARGAVTVEGHEGDESPLLPYKDEVLGAMTSGIKNPPTRRPAIVGLIALVTTNSLLSDEEIGFIVHNVNEILQADYDRPELDEASDELLDLLITISTSSSPRHVEEQTLPLLFSALSDVAPEREANIERNKSWRILAALEKLCLQSELFETFIIRLTTKLDLLGVPAGERSPDAHEPAAAYAHAILKTISQTLSAKVNAGHPDVTKYVDRLLPRLYNLFIYSALDSGERELIATNPRLIAVAGEIITLVVQSVPAQRQEVFSKALFDAFLAGNVKGIAEGHQKIPADRTFLPFNLDAPIAHKNLVTLFAAAVVPLHQELAIPVAKPTDFLDMMLTWGLTNTDNNLQKDAAKHIVAAILNKRVDDVPDFLEDKLARFWPHEVGDPSRPVDQRKEAMKAWTWISRALVIRSHPLAMQFVDRLFDVFGDSSINWDAARAIGYIGAQDDVLTKKHHTVVKILHAQKFSNAILLGSLRVRRIQAVDPLTQTAHLVAMASLIKSSPKATYEPQMASLVPLLLRGLDLPDPSIRADVIDTLFAAAQGASADANPISEHAPALIACMLRNCTAREMPTMRVRVAALRYLAVLPSIVRYDKLHPQKAGVIRALAEALDDPKRAVRREAVEARTNWCVHYG